jgi:16S rRNA (guanine966-N2)-methyltransferase
MPNNEIRIVGGVWKRSKLPVADRPGLRPTPDRVRETLFNWLGQDLTGWHCIDVFAGTGALGFEAASRGAQDVLLVEQDPALVGHLEATQVKLQAHAVRILRGDGMAVLKKLTPASMDAVFLDPPFDSNLLEGALRSAATAIKPASYVYLETPSAWTQEQLAPFGFTAFRHLKAGAVHAQLLKRA